jgi:hypothetical protein
VIAVVPRDVESRRHYSRPAIALALAPWPVVGATAAAEDWPAARGAGVPRGGGHGVIVHLPAEKIVVAGNLLDHPVPYLGGGYPLELIETAERMRRVEPATIVPGHGKVLRGTAYLALLTDFLRAVVAAVDQEIQRVRSRDRETSRASPVTPPGTGRGCIGRRARNR